VVVPSPPNEPLRLRGGSLPQVEVRNRNLPAWLLPGGESDESSWSSGWSLSDVDSDKLPADDDTYSEAGFSGSCHCGSSFLRYSVPKELRKFHTVKGNTLTSVQFGLCCQARALPVVYFIRGVLALLESFPNSRVAELNPETKRRVRRFAKFFLYGFNPYAHSVSSFCVGPWDKVDRHRDGVKGLYYFEHLKRRLHYLARISRA